MLTGWDWVLGESARSCLEEYYGSKLDLSDVCSYMSKGSIRRMLNNIVDETSSGEFSDLDMARRAREALKELNK